MAERERVTRSTGPDMNDKGRPAMRWGIEGA
jgi:hypothetical protein